MPCWPLHRRRTTWIASSSADTDSPGVRAGVVGLDPIPETARAKAELEPADDKDVERGGCFGEHGWWAQLDVGHVGEDGDPLSAHGNRCEQSPRVVEAALVGVILDPDQVEAKLVRQDGVVHGSLGRFRGDEDAKPNRLPVVQVQDYKIGRRAISCRGGTGGARSTGGSPRRRMR